MRKCYFLLLGLLSFIGVNTVSADTYSADSFYQNFDEYLEDYNLNKVKFSSSKIKDKNTIPAYSSVVL